MNIEKLDGGLMIRAIHGAVNYLVLNKEEVNSLNVFPVPDGDTGTNMSLTVKSALKQVQSVEELTAANIAKAAARGSLMGARGNSGVILSQFLRGFSESCVDKKELSIQDLAQALKKASETTYNAVMKPTEGTILTVGRELSDFAIKNFRRYTDILEFLKDIIVEANRSLDETPEKLAVLKEAGVVDAGGKGLCVLIEGAYKALMGEEIVSEDDQTLKNKQQKEVRMDEGDESIKFGYCTEFIIHTDNEDLETFKSKLSPLGDCLLVVGGAGTGLIKVHVHTNEPGKALQYGLELGALQDIKIDNMRFQHQERLFSEEEVESSKAPVKQESVIEEKDNSIIAVSMGSGLSQVFKSLGVDFIVEGGQTMNPSTEDFVNAINSVGGKNIYILPNNSNIILAAQQAAELSERNVYVVPSKAVPEGIHAALSLNENLTGEENLGQMSEKLKEITSAQVTYAVRDTQMNGIDIKTGDIIGLSGKEIITGGHDINEVTFDLISKLYDESQYMITVYVGAEINDEQADELKEKIEDEFDECDVEFIRGEQPIYYYLISLES